MTDLSRPRRARFLAAVTCLLAAAALALPGTGRAEAGGEPAAPISTASSTASDAGLAAAARAVLAADIAGTAWAVDHAADAVRVTADATVSDAALDRLTRAAGPLPGALTIERVPGTLRPHLMAGEPAHADAGWRCTAGLNVRSGSSYYFLTAGHCTEDATNWYTDVGRSTLVGPTQGTSFPGNDYGLVRYDNSAVPHPGTVTCGGTVIDITGAANPTLGMTASFAGAISGCLTGTVRGLNHTVNYGNGDVVSGLFSVSLCAQHGDSGGLLFSGNTALGLLSGGTASCATGGTAYFQPVPEVLGAYGVSVH